jgi:uncharacterized membrane protein
MRHLGLIAKIAFICNLFFIGCILLQRAAPAGTTAVVSVVAILGLVLGLCIVNPVSNILTGIAWLRYKKLPQSVPGWLALANLFCLLLQIFYILHTWS